MHSSQIRRGWGGGGRLVSICSPLLFNLNTRLLNLRYNLKKIKTGVLNTFFLPFILALSSFLVIFDVESKTLDQVVVKEGEVGLYAYIKFYSAQAARRALAGLAGRCLGWKFMSCNHCQEFCQQARWLLIGCKKENN